MKESDLRERLKEAMRAKDKVRTATLRNTIAALKNKAIEKRVEVLPAADALAVIQREAKQCRETLDFARKAEREDTVAEQEAVLAILEELLPKQLSGDELRAVIGAIREETGAAKIGPIMKALSERHAGCYDGKTASAVVREVLAKADAEAD